MKYPAGLTQPTKRNFIKAARELAYYLHRDQKDKTGNPYREHLDAVYLGVIVLGGSDYAKAAALLHDSVEDQYMKFGGTIARCLDQLLEWGYPPFVVELIDAVTKRPGEAQASVIARIDALAEKHKSKDPNILKAADTLNNMRHDRHDELPEWTQDRHKKKYQPSLAHHLERIGVISTQTFHGELLAKKPVGQGTSWINSGKPRNYGAIVPTSVKGSTVIEWDWPLGYPAPIDRRVPMQLEQYYDKNGNTVIIKANEPILVYTKASWQAKQKKDPTWSPAHESRTGTKTP